MADVVERPGQVASELPTKYLPGVEYRDLPEPLPLRKIVGASVVLLATYAAPAPRPPVAV